MSAATPTAVELALLALAAFRLTRLLGWDTFPPALRFREWVQGIDAEGNITHDRPNWWVDLWDCPFCLGFWVSLAVALAWWVVPTAALVVALPFALSAFVGLVAKRLDP